MFTDWLDGYLARVTKTVSSFGKVADPIADKILILGTLIALTQSKDFNIPLWAVFIMVIRELIIGGVRVIAGAQGIVLAADRGGKIKTAIQLTLIFFMLCIVVLVDYHAASAWMARSVYGMSVLCALLSVSSLWSYLRQYRAMLEQSWS